MKKKQQNRQNILIMIVLTIWMTPQLLAQKTATFRTNAKEFKHVQRDKDPMKSNGCEQATYRSIDGTCNNTSIVTRNEWGAADVFLKRDMTAEYGDPDHNNDMAGQDRPSPRAVSNALSAQATSVESGVGLSSFVFTWGQFLDHDIDLTPEGHTEYEPIVLPEEEPLMTIDIPFFRSAVHEGTGENSYRQQTNLITAWIDASNVYGSEESRATWLRTFQRGKLKTSAGDLLPFNTVDGEYDSEIDVTAPSMAGDGGGTTKTFVAGDVRASEQPGLTSLHTLFVREHNRICDRLYEQGLRDDEEMYQTARKRVGGIIQAITYREFLPALGVQLSDYNGYKPHIHPNISNIFATAAYRLGHTMVTEELLLVDNQCNDVDDGSVSLLEGFFNPEVVRTHNIVPILKGLSVQTQQEVDLMIIDNLRNLLFGDPTTPGAFGLDLAALNMQRGRDHGLPDYNKIRGYYIGVRANRFDEINSDPAIWTALADTYNDDINNIDPWVGMLAERRLPGRSVGRTLHAILKKQFENLRDGDFYYYQHDPFLDNQTKDRIRNTQLSEVILRNSTIERLADNVFMAEDCVVPNTGGGGNGGNGNGGNGGGGNGGNGNGGGNGGGGNGGNGNGGGNGGNGNGGNLIEDGSASFHQLKGVLQISPNPTTSQVHLSFQATESSTIQWRILNANGQVMRQNRSGAVSDYYQQQIDVSDLPKGVYFVQLQTEKDSFTEKLLIQ